MINIKTDANFHSTIIIKQRQFVGWSYSFMKLDETNRIISTNSDRLRHMSKLAKSKNPDQVLNYNLDFLFNV